MTEADLAKVWHEADDYERGSSLWMQSNVFDHIYYHELDFWKIVDMVRDMERS